MIGRDAGHACEAYAWQSCRVARLPWADQAQIVSAQGDLDHLRLIVRTVHDRACALIDAAGNAVCEFPAAGSANHEHVDWEHERTYELLVDLNAAIHDHATLRTVAWRTGAVTTTELALPRAFRPATAP